MDYNLNNALLIAHDAWQVELRRAYGKHAPEACFCESGKGQPGTNLRRAYNEYAFCREQVQAERMARHA